MSNITSNSYPVITVTKAGDQFVVVQNGQLKKLNRQGLQDFITELAPNTILSLSDTPGTFVGQQGKGLVVNATEDAMEFAPTVSSNFITLTDTPAGYGGNGDKFVAVNTAENALEFIDSTFLANADTPSSYAGQGGMVLKVNPGETGIEFATPVSVNGNYSGGFFDYEHGGGTQAYTGGSGPLKLLNDEAGINTIKTYAPPGITDVWDATGNVFDFTELDLADQVEFRLDLTVTTTAPNQIINIYLELGSGTGSEYTIPFVNTTVRDAGAYRATRYNGIYIGNALTRDNPGAFYFTSPSNATIQVNGWYVNVTQRGIE